MMHLRDEITGIERTTSRWYLTFGDYIRMADRCGVQRNEHLRIATMFLHDMGVLR